MTHASRFAPVIFYKKKKIDNNCYLTRKFLIIQKYLAGVFKKVFFRKTMVSYWRILPFLFP